MGTVTGIDAAGVNIRRRGLMLALSSPSGAGKTSISRALLDLDPNLELSISVTTRPKRRSEQTGRDYIFVDPTEFDLMVNRQEFLEYAKVFGFYYGTPREPVEQALTAGRDILFDIDWQGTQQLDEAAREDLVSVFILPPSTVELERRLHDRAQDSEIEIGKRMARAAEEMTHYSEYRYVVVNWDFETTLAQVQAILKAEQLRRQRQIGLSDFVTRLRQGR